MDVFTYALTFVAALGCGVVSGAFFVFSAFVMKGLGRLPEARGLAAMREINAAAVTPAFMVAFLGTAAICAVLVVRSLFAWDAPYAPYLLIGGAVYMIGAFGLTVVYDVPCNDALAAAKPDEAENYWRVYLSRWTTWNHVRTAASLVASAALILALQIG